MSKRECRDSDSKRQLSRIDREPSPKRSRRDGKPEAEGVVSKKDLDVKDGSETDKKPRQSLRDAAPDAHAHALSKDKHSGDHETTKQAPHEPPRSRPYHQHDDLRVAGKGVRRATSERGSWRGSRAADQDRSTRRQDRFHDTQGALSRKRPAFREKKIPEESGNKTERTRTEEAKDTYRRQNEGSWRSNMHSERHGTGVWNRGDERGRQSYRDGFSRNWRTRDEKKWDHDLFEEANKSPARANEDEQIAKVEALLAS